MTDGGQDFNLGHVVGATGQTGPSGADGLTVWNTSTAPTYANSKYTFTISNLNGKTGLNVAVNDIIFYDTYYYIISAVNSTTVDCTTRVNIKGSDASVTIVTSWSGTLSDSKVPSEKLTKNNLDGKVDKVTGKGLSTEDYTSTEKTKLSGIETGANNYTHPSSKQCNYAPDLSNYVQKSSTSGLIKNDGSIDTSSYLTTGTASSTYVAQSDIANNLTTTTAGKVLDARQGKALADLIGDAIDYINL